MTAAFQFTWEVVESNTSRIVSGMEQRADAAVRAATLMLQAGAQQRAPVDTGFLRASIQATFPARYQGVVTVGADYGLYVEYGTVHQAPQPFLDPAVEAVRPGFVQAMRKVVA